MATRHRETKGKAGKRPAGKAHGGSSGSHHRSSGSPHHAARKRTSGARKAPGAEAARELEQPTWPAPAELVEGPDRPQLRLADAPTGAPPGIAETAPARRAGEDRDADVERQADRAAARIAREIEEGVTGAAEDLHDMRRRADAASRELGRRREEREANREQEEREVPGYGAIALELLRGAMRLVGAIVTAPLRIGLAVLRPREA